MEDSYVVGLAALRMFGALIGNASGQRYMQASISFNFMNTALLTIKQHMDKHDRPYKCPADGCEKLPGFTYSGGLLRHQREVHNLHGGPRKQLNCPHPNCKRFSGKGFSRQENLNEHLRRVHTDTGDMVNVGSEETEEDAEELRTGMKRKRGPQQDDSGDLRQEMARLRNENDELRRQTETLMHQMNSLQQLVGNRLQQATQHIQAHQAPQATMM